MTIRLPESEAELKAWAEQRPQRSVCGSYMRCLVSDYVTEHNPGLEDVMTFPSARDPNGGFISWVHLGRRGIERAPMPVWLNKVALRFDELSPQPDEYYLPTAKEVLSLFES